VILLAVTLLTSACGSSDASVDASFGRDDPVPPTEPTLAATDTPSTTATADGASTTTTTAGTTDTTTVPATTAPVTTVLVVPASTTTAPTTVPVPTTTTLPPLVPVEPIPAAEAPDRAPVDPSFGATNAAFDRLAVNNVGASLSVVRGGELVVSRATGLTIDGSPATGDTPFVVASVSKLVLGVALARLHQQGLIDVAEPVPWGEIGIWPGNGWTDVTLWELMNHSAGVPVARSTWFTGGAHCEEHIVPLVSSPPRGHRGTWTYSNGNYCLLGMVIEARTGLPLGEAVQQLVFDPVGADGVHLTLDGLLPGDMPHPHGAGVQRLSRLGGAGTLVVSTDDLALAIGRLTDADVEIVRRGVFVDQYGFGHTGTVDGAKACTWWLDGGDTVISATIAGDARSTGGAVCDLVIPAIATDLGIAAGRPNRSS
jgi:D-alanyl-D-alanine carboxypeptidase